MRHISNVARPMIADVIMRFISQADATNNRIAAENAMGCNVSFMAHDEYPHLCDIVCTNCDNAWIDTLTSYYAKYPFGCPTCGPESKRNAWEGRAGHEMRTKTADAIQAEMLPKVKRSIFSLPEAERGPLFGRCKKIERDGAQIEDFRWMQEMLEPEAELVE